MNLDAYGPIMLAQKESRASSPRQFKVPKPTVHARRRTQKPRSQQLGSKKQLDKQKDPATSALDARLFKSPQLKAVAPYAPKSEGEDLNLRFLIHYYVTLVTAKTVTCVGPRFEWYPLAVRDEAFFHALISSTSSHAAYRQKVELPRNFYFHRGEAIRMVNERLANGAHDEGTINAIAVFAQQESWEGRRQSCLVHLKGMLQLVRDAGGMQSPILSAKTRRHVFLTDLSVSLVLMTRPLVPPAVGSDLKTYFGRPSATTAKYVKTFGLRLFNFTGSALSDQAAKVLWGLRNVSAILEAINDGTASPDAVLPDDIQFSDRVEVLERLVIDLWFVEDSDNEQHPIFRTFGWACIIYIYTVLRELPPELGMNPMLAARIKTALEACPDLNVLLATFQDLLLWQMFICGRVADARDQPFFASQASKILMIRKIENESDIIVASEGFLWPERLIELPVRTAAVLTLLGT